MPHKCIKCGKIYFEGDKKIFKGCNCGSKLFIYIPKEKLKNIEEKEIDLDFKDFYEILRIKKEDIVILPFESIRKIDEGKYLIDLSKLFKEKVVVIKIKEGKYLIDL